MADNPDEEQLSGLVQSGILETVESEAFDRICWLVSEVINTSATIITLLNGQRFWMRSDLGFSTEDVNRSLVRFHESVTSSDILEINDAYVDPSFFDSDLVDRHNGVRFFAGAPILDPNGFVCGVLTILDVNPRKLTQNERTKLRCFADQVENEIKILLLMQEESDLRFEVSKAFNAKSTFLSQMSHEIRTPIAGIIGATDLLLSGSKRDSPELLNSIRTSASDLLQLLNETLDSAKIEAGGLHIQSVPVDLVSIAEKLRRHFRPLAESKNLDFRVDIDVQSDLPDFVKSDPLRLRQILFNIIHNAMKFTERGSVGCSMTLSKGENDVFARLDLTISDTGMGMTEKTLQTLFEPFRQGEEGEERSYEGTGLGMSLVKQLTERMGGEIHVDSVIGRGTTISISIPVQPDHDVWVTSNQGLEDSAAPARPAEVIQVNDLKDMQVLVADDNAQNRLILEKVVSSWGCEVTSVDNGQAALDTALASAFDAIILDLHMPSKSGFEVARALRQYTSSTKLIACSADTTESAYAKSIDSGFDHQVEKPFDWPKLYHALTTPKATIADHFKAQEAV